MKLIRLILPIFVALLIVLFFAAYYILHHPTVDKVFKPTHPVLVVDMSNNNLLTIADLNKGEDAILIVQSHAETEWVSSLDVLLKFDLNKDKQIDKQDKIYGRLALLYFPGDLKKQKIVSLEKAGIKAIVFSQAVMQTLPKSSQAVEHITAGYVITKDNKKRKINVLQVSY